MGKKSKSVAKQAKNEEISVRQAVATEERHRRTMMVLPHYDNPTCCNHGVDRSAGDPAMWAERERAVKAFLGWFHEAKEANWIPKPSILAEDKFFPHFEHCVDQHLFDLLISTGVDYMAAYGQYSEAKYMLDFCQVIEIRLINEKKKLLADSKMFDVEQKPVRVESHLDMIRLYCQIIPCSCLEPTKKEFKKLPELARCHNDNCKVTVEKKKLLVCTACKVASYCSEACQKEHWKLEHKKICKRIQEYNVVF